MAALSLAIRRPSSGLQSLGGQRQESVRFECKTGLLRGGVQLVHVDAAEFLAALRIEFADNRHAFAGLRWSEAALDQAGIVFVASNIGYVMLGLYPADEVLPDLLVIEGRLGECQSGEQRKQKEMRKYHLKKVDACEWPRVPRENAGLWLRRGVRSRAVRSGTGQ